MQKIIFWILSEANVGVWCIYQSANIRIIYWIEWNVYCLNYYLLNVLIGVKLFALKSFFLWCSGCEHCSSHGQSGFDIRLHHSTLKPWAHFLSGIAYHLYKPKASEWLYRYMHNMPCPIKDICLIIIIIIIILYYIIIEFL